MAEASFSDLLELHRELDEVFTQHQELLLSLQIERAAELFAAYRDLLDVHMQHEEQTLLPIFARAGNVPRWPLVLYTGQHEKMRGMLDRIASAVDAAKGQTTTSLRRAVIRILELETTYKHLAEHHDGAERDGLFPVADRVTEPDERRELMSRFRSEFAAARQRHDALFERVRDELL